jgi:hypothetical protein
MYCQRGRNSFLILTLCITVGLQACKKEGTEGSSHAISTGGSPTPSNSTTVPSLSISTISPVSVVTGNTVTIDGAGFNAGIIAQVGGINCSTSTFISNTSMSCVVPPGLVLGPSDVTVTNVDSGSATSGPGSIMFMGAPALWIDIADSTTITQSSGSVSSVTNKGTFADSFSQSTLAKQPTYISNAQNSLPTLRLNGTSQYLSISPFTGSLGSRTIFAVTRLDTASPSGAAAAGSVISVTTADLNSPAFDAVVYNELNPQRWMNGSDNYNRTSGTGTNIDEISTSPILLAVRYTTSSYTFLRNGNQLASTTSYTPEFISNGIVYIGLRLFYNGVETPDGYYNGDISEIVVYDSMLGDADYNKVTSYLNSKWALY